MAIQQTSTQIDRVLDPKPPFEDDPLFRDSLTFLNLWGSDWRNNDCFCIRNADVLIRTWSVDTWMTARQSGWSSTRSVEEGNFRLDNPFLPRSINLKCFISINVKNSGNPQKSSRIWLSFSLDSLVHCPCSLRFHILRPSYRRYKGWTRTFVPWCYYLLFLWIGCEAWWDTYVWLGRDSTKREGANLIASYTIETMMRN